MNPAGPRAIRHRGGPAAAQADLLADLPPPLVPTSPPLVPTSPSAAAAAVLRPPTAARRARAGARGMVLVGAFGCLLAVLGAAVTLEPVLTARPTSAGVLPSARPGGSVPAQIVPSVLPTDIAGAASSPAVSAPAAAIGQDVRSAAVFVPTVVLLPSGRSAEVLPAGVRADGSLVVPENPARVGWWNGGALAGEPFGSVVLAGHVDSRRYGVGIMAELRRLRPGDVVVLRDGAGHSLRYRIDSLERVAKARLGADADPFRQDVTHRLVLITCGGPYDHTAHRYPDNLVATATPVG